jgi:hypothetical protein
MCHSVGYDYAVKHTTAATPTKFDGAGVYLHAAIHRNAY